MMSASSRAFRSESCASMWKAATTWLSFALRTSRGAVDAIPGRTSTGEQAEHRQDRDGLLRSAVRAKPSHVTPCS